MYAYVRCDASVVVGKGNEHETAGKGSAQPGLLIRTLPPRLEKSLRLLRLRTSFVQRWRTPCPLRLAQAHLLLPENLLYQPDKADDKVRQVVVTGAENLLRTRREIIRLELCRRHFVALVGRKVSVVYVYAYVCF